MRSSILAAPGVTGICGVGSSFPGQEQRRTPTSGTTRRIVISTGVGMFVLADSVTLAA
jgi:hypothetical protein